MGQSRASSLARRLRVAVEGHYGVSGHSDYGDRDFWGRITDVLDSALAHKEPCMPVMDGPDIPLSFLRPYDRDVRLNHSQSLEWLAVNGGLCCGEIVAIIEGTPKRTPQLGDRRKVAAFLTQCQRKSA